MPKLVSDGRGTIFFTPVAANEHEVVPPSLIEIRRQQDVSRLLDGHPQRFLRAHQTQEECSLWTYFVHDLLKLIGIEHRTADLRSVQKIDVLSDCSSPPEMLFLPFYPNEVAGICVEAHPDFVFRLTLFNSSQETVELKPQSSFHVSEIGMKFPQSFSYTRRRKSKLQTKSSTAVVYLFGIE